MKVNLSIGSTYSSCRQSNGQTKQAGELSYRPTRSKTDKLTKSTFVVWNLNNVSACFVFYFINIYTCINLYFISRLNQDSLTLSYTRQTPPPQISTVLFHPPTESQVKYVGQPMLWILLLVRKGFPPWPTRTKYYTNHMARLARTPINYPLLLGLRLLYLCLPRFVNQ